MVVVDLEKCVGCGKCERTCPNGAIKVVDKKAVLNRDLCSECGKCVQVCPTKALSIEYTSTHVRLAESYGWRGGGCGRGRGGGFGKKRRGRNRCGW